MNLIFILIPSQLKVTWKKVFLLKLDVMSRNIDNIKQIMEKSRLMISYFSENLERDTQNEKVQ